MFERYRVRSTVTVAVVAAIAFCAGATTIALALGTIPGGDGLVHACYNTHSGALHLVPDGATCDNGDAAISWPTKDYADGLLAAEIAARKQGDIDTLAASSKYTDAGIAAEAAARASADQSLGARIDGKVSSISGGKGIAVNGPSTTPIVGLDPAYALPQGCSGGQIAKAIAGGWTCGDDANTTYSAGQGLSLSGTTFSLADGGVSNAKLANAAVTAAKVSADGSKPGQALISDGTNASWQNIPVPASNGLASFDALEGLPCNLNSPSKGQIHIAYGDTGVVSIVCAATAYTLTIGSFVGGTVTSTPAGISCTDGIGSGCSASFTPNSSVTLTAAPNPGFTFVGWGGVCTGTSSCAVLMDRVRSVTPAFTGLQSLTVTLVGSGTVTSLPAGIACGATCAASFPQGTTVTLTASASGGAAFAGWSGACAGTTCAIVMDGPKAVTAAFGVTHAVTVQVTGGVTTIPRCDPRFQTCTSGGGSVASSPSGLSCDDIPPSPSTNVCTTQFLEGTTVILTATGRDAVSFETWSGACLGSAPTCSITVDSDKSITATFVAPLMLTVELKTTLNCRVCASGAEVISSPPGITCSHGSCSAPFPKGTIVTLTASPASMFDAWSGSCGGSSPTCTITMDADTSVTASFGDPYSLSVHVPGPIPCPSLACTANGSVVSSPAGIACGDVAFSSCDHQFAPGTAVTLTATADPGYVFEGWSGDCVATSGDCSLTIDGARSVTARFAPATLTVSLQEAFCGATCRLAGSVVSSPAGIDCSLSSDLCAAAFSTGSTVTLTVTPDAGALFTGWSGDCTGTAATCTIMIDTPKQVTAKFILEP